MIKDLPADRTRALMCFQPVDPRPYLCIGRYPLRQGQRCLHTTHYYGFNYIQFVLVGVKDQFVMHLQQHLRPKPPAAELFMHPDHGQLDHIGSSPLDGRVDGIPLGKAPDGEIGGIDVF